MIGNGNDGLIGLQMPQLTEDHQSVLDFGSQLAERWSKFPGKKIKGWEKINRVNFMEGVEDPYRRALVGTLLENAYRYYAKMDETTRSLAVGNYEKYIFPVIRMVFANLVAADLVSVQSLPNPTGLIFYYDAVAGSTKGKITKGTKLFSAKTGPNQSSYNYTTELIDTESVGATVGSGVISTFTCGYYPIRPGTFLLTDGTNVVTDDGNGTIIGNVGSGSAVINYATGTVTSMSLVLGTQTSASVALTATYEYNSEGSNLIPDLDLQLSSAPVITRANKIRARWSMEAEQDLLAAHGISAEVDLVTLTTNRIAQEINNKITQHIRTIAPNADNVITFDITPPVEVPYRDHKEILIDAFVETSNVIFSQTQRIEPNWLIVGVNVANVVETLAPHFVRIPSPPGVAGIRKIGKLGDWDVYKDPAFPANEWLMGYKGGNMLDTGYVHAVYQGLVSTPTFTLDDFITRKGLMSRTAQKVVNENFYARGTLVQTGYDPVQGPGAASTGIGSPLSSTVGWPGQASTLPWHTTTS